jgi:outer membrane protein assembly factor BamB
MLKLKDHFITGVCLAAAAMLCGTAVAGEDPTTFLTKQIAGMKVGKHDWPQWGGSTSRNNTPDAKNVPITWDVESGENILWSMPLGSETYGNPVIANGKVYVGTNNGNGYIERYASSVDLGCLICFDEKDGKFLWQHSSEKLSTGRVHDWPNQGICASPFVDGNRLWYVSSRGCVVCLDTEGFLDGENDSPYVEEQVTDKGEADVVWELDMMKELSVSQHNMCSCSITSVGDLLFVNTGNGVDEGHFTIPEEGAPSFICINRNSGQVLWTDKSPGANILHGQWSSPAYGVFDGVAQVLFAGGDGYMYSFSAEGKDGKSELLWKFDCNPKRTLYTLTRATRNHLIAIPVVYDGSVYIAVGEDPEHGDGQGHLWCIDPTKRGDVSPTIVYNTKEPNKPIAPKRLQAMDEKAGDFERENPNSAAVWHYIGEDPSAFETTMHRTMGTVAIKNNLLFVLDFGGLFHCVDAKTGKGHWTYDMFAECWGSPLIVEDRVYIGDTDGEICIFKLAPEMELLSEVNMGSSVVATPVVANGIMFIANRNRVFAIQEGAKSEPVK